MAGAGYKLFNTGDVLTAAQVNTYLQEQTVMVFANSTARTTALSGVLAEGMMSYLQDTNAVEVYNGTSWVNVGNAGDLTEIVAGTGITVTSGTGPIPTVALTTPVAATNGGTAQSTYTTGDLLYASGTNTLAKRAIGTTGQVLTVSGGVPTWAAAAGGGGANWALENAGGTALTGAATITVSGISGKDKILILVQDASINNTSADTVQFRFNTDTGTNYYVYGWALQMSTSYSAQNLETYDGAKNAIDMAGQGYSNSSIASGYLLMSGANSSGVKAFHFGGGGQDTQQLPRTYNGGGYYNSSSTISSVSLTCSGGSFDGGTMWVYTSA